MSTLNGNVRNIKTHGLQLHMHNLKNTSKTSQLT